MTVKDLKEHLEKHYNETDEVAYTIWSKEDVEDQASRKSVELTNEEISDVLELVYDHHDASLGISWTTIDCAIDLVVENRK